MPEGDRAGNAKASVFWVGGRSQFMCQGGSSRMLDTGQANASEAIESTVDLYKVFIEDANHLREERQSDNNVRVTIASLLLGGEAIMAIILLSPALGKDLASFSLPPLVAGLAMLGVAVVGWVFCHNWLNLLDDYKQTLGFKYSRLLKLEKRYPELQSRGGTLFTDEEENRKSPRGSTKRTQQLAGFFRWVFVAILVAALAVKVLSLPPIAVWLPSWLLRS
jgi:hypothetical protein